MIGLGRRTGVILGNLALLLAAASPVRAVEPTAIDAPEGWKRTRTTAGVAIYQPEGLAQGEDVRIVIFPGEETGGDFRKWFDAARAGLEEGERVSGGGKVEASKSKTGAPLLTADVVTNSKSHGFRLRRYVAANAGGKAEMILYRAGGAGLFEKYEPTFKEMTLTWRDAWSGAPAAARKKAAAKARVPRDEIPEDDRGDGADHAPPAARAEGEADAETERKAPGRTGEAGGAVEKVAETPRRPGWVVGSVTNMSGKPPRDAQLIVEIGGVTLRGGERTFFTATVKPDGTFAQRVPEGLYSVRCDAVVDYQGRQFKVPVESQDGEPRDARTESSSGIAKDFRLRVQGLKNGGNKAKFEDHIGGAVGLHNALKNAYPGATVELTLTPQGPLLDGSEAQTQRLKYGIDWVTAAGHRGRYYQNLALGRYTATAVLIEANGAKIRLKLEPDIGSGRGQESIDVITEPGKYLWIYVSE